jgi:hypothetical protein
MHLLSHALQAGTEADAHTLLTGPDREAGLISRNTHCRASASYFELRVKDVATDSGDVRSVAVANPMTPSPSELSESLCHLFSEVAGFRARGSRSLAQLTGPWSIRRL